MTRRHGYVDYEKHLEYQRKYNNEHKEHYDEYKKDWYERNKNQVIERSKQYYEENKERVKERIRQRATKRRSNYLANKSCVVCGSTADLELDHIVPHKKNKGVDWSAKLENLEEELLLCQVLCRRHHMEKSKINGDYGKLTQKEANQIKDLLKEKTYTQKELSVLYDVSQANISMIKLGKIWK